MGNILLTDTIMATETENHIKYPQQHEFGHAPKIDSDSESILQLLTTMDSADDSDGDADDDEVYIPRRSRNTPTTQQQKESDSSVIIAKKITLGKLIQKISSILESVKQDIASRTGSRSSSNSMQQQQGEILSRKAYLWTTMEDFRLLTSEKMKLVEELL